MPDGLKKPTPFRVPALSLVLLLAAAVLIPRSIAISGSHSESSDEEYHLTRGLAFLARDLASVDLGALTLVNDPPLGAGILALPLWVDNQVRGLPPTTFRPVDHPFGPNFLLELVAAWKAVLFMPLIGVVFAWCRSLYGPRSAWLAAGLIVVEPTVAAHVPIPALDALGAESIVISAYLAWRMFQRPSWGRVISAGVGFAVALAIKHTALVLPPILAAYAGLCWVVQPILERRGWADLPSRFVDQVRTSGLLAVTTALTLWAVLLFDVSPKSLEDLWTTIHVPPAAIKTTVEGKGRARPVEVWPAGSYLRSLKQGMTHNRKGHPAYLLGDKRRDGWWYYFPVVAAVKIPVGLMVILGLGVFSVAWNRPRWAEWGLAIPAGACLALAIRTQINIGFRHFLPAYLFLLMLASRSLVGASPRLVVLVWAVVAGVGLQGLGVHPDELCFTNGLWSRPYLAISDSNVDWGQGLKQVRDWYDARPADSRVIRFGYFGNGMTPPRYLGDRPIQILWERNPLPDDGLLIVSPVLVAGPYDPRGNYHALRGIEPDETIGHSLMLYDLDRLHREGRLPRRDVPGD